MRFCVVNMQKKGRGLLKLLLVIVALFLLFLWVMMKIRPVIISVAKGYGENVVANRLNEMIAEELERMEFDFTEVTFSPDGKISGVKMDSYRVNTFMTDIVLVLKDRILEMEEIEVEIPLGNFVSNPFFSGLGPKIPIKFIILTNTNVTLDEHFYEKGINQTLYVINLRVDTKVSLYIPGMNENMTVTNILPLSQHIIVGDVPDTYTNVEGMDGSVQDAVLDVD